MASADMSISPTVGVEGDGAMSAGEFVLKKLFAEFVVLSERKLQEIASQPPVSNCGQLRGSLCIHISQESQTQFQCSCLLVTLSQNNGGPAAKVWFVEVCLKRHNYVRANQGMRS